MLFTNLVSTRRIFSIAFYSEEHNKDIIYSVMEGVDDRHKIIKLLKTHNVLVGFNINKYESVILSYVINNLSSGVEDIYEFSLKLERLLLSGNYKYDEEYKDYKKKTYFLGIIDLQKINNIDNRNVLKTGIKLNHENIFNIDKYANRMDVSFKYEIDEFLKNRNSIIFKLYNESQETLRNRKNLSEEYGSDFMCSTDIDISNKIVESLYITGSGKSSYDIKQDIVEYDSISLKEVLPDIEFSNKNLVKLYNDLKEFEIRPDNKVNMTVATKELVHNFKQGGIHGVSKPNIFTANNEYDLLYIDFNSFYGNLIVNNNIKPSHVSNRFIDVIKDLINRREEVRNTDPILNSMFKLAIASISGNYSAKSSIFRDFKAAIRLYMTGQLTLLKVIDDVELIDGVSCIFSNTDGIILKVNKASLNELKTALISIRKDINIPWEGIMLKRLIVKDINNYAKISINNEFTGVGIFDREKSLSNTTIPNIVNKAIINYYMFNIPIDETVMKSKNILDFSFEKPKDSEFNLGYEYSQGYEKLSRINRFFISKKYGNIVITKNDSKTRKPLIDGYSIELLNIINDNVDYIRNVNYKYYTSMINSIINSINTTQLSLF